jgi:hypothetical protein
MDYYYYLFLGPPSYCLFQIYIGDALRNKKECGGIESYYVAMFVAYRSAM